MESGKRTGGDTSSTADAVSREGLNRREVLLATTALAAAAAAVASSPQEAVAQQKQASGGTNRPPNIVYFLVDNLGFGELGSYGGGILRGAETRRIDAFAAEGIKLLNFAPEAQCTPSRSALMTGRYAIRSGNHTVALSWCSARSYRTPFADPTAPVVAKLGRSEGIGQAVTVSSDSLVETTLQ